MRFLGDAFITASGSRQHLAVERPGQRVDRGAESAGSQPTSGGVTHLPRRRADARTAPAARNRPRPQPEAQAAQSVSAPRQAVVAQPSTGRCVNAVERAALALCSLNLAQDRDSRAGDSPAGCRDPGTHLRPVMTADPMPPAGGVAATATPRTPAAPARPAHNRRRRRRLHGMSAGQSREETGDVGQGPSSPRPGGVATTWRVI